MTFFSLSPGNTPLHLAVMMGHKGEYVSEHELRQSGSFIAS